MFLWKKECKVNLETNKNLKNSKQYNHLPQQQRRIFILDHCFDMTLFVDMEIWNVSTMRLELAE